VHVLGSRDGDDPHHHEGRGPPDEQSWSAEPSTFERDRREHRPPRGDERQTELRGDRERDADQSRHDREGTDRRQCPHPR